MIRMRQKNFGFLAALVATFFAFARPVTAAEQCVQLFKRESATASPLTLTLEQYGLGRWARELEDGGMVRLDTTLAPLSKKTTEEVEKEYGRLASLKRGGASTPASEIETCLYFAELLLRADIKVGILRIQDVRDLSGLAVEILGSRSGGEKLDRILAKAKSRTGAVLRVPYQIMAYDPVYDGLSSKAAVYLAPRIVLKNRENLTIEPPTILLHELQHFHHRASRKFSFLNVRFVPNDAHGLRSVNYRHGFVAGELETFLADAHILLQEMESSPTAEKRQLILDKARDIRDFFDVMSAVTAQISPQLESSASKVAFHNSESGDLYFAVQGHEGSVVVPDL